MAGLYGRFSITDRQRSNFCCAFKACEGITMQVIDANAAIIGSLDFIRLLLYSDISKSELIKPSADTKRDARDRILTIKTKTSAASWPRIPTSF